MSGSTATAPIATVVDLEIQNILSVENALRTIGAQVRVVKDAAGIADADFLVLPGVGSFGTAAARLHESGIAEAIRRHALQRHKPVMGLCLGMQLLADSSTEHGTHAGLGLIAGKVLRLEESPPDYRVPNVGWREVRLRPLARALLPDALDGRSFYHVHSFHFQPADASHVLGVSRFGDHDVASIVGRENVFGTQFHPEKSQDAGLDLLHAVLHGLR